MWLTRGVDYGLIRPVARIAQSVEQGIENPRVLGSIPSPGTTIQRTRPKGGFLRFCSRTLHRTAFDYSPPAAHPFGAGATGAPFDAFGASPNRSAGKSHVPDYIFRQFESKRWNTHSVDLYIKSGIHISTALSPLLFRVDKTVYHRPHSSYIYQ